MWHKYKILCITNQKILQTMLLNSTNSSTNNRELLDPEEPEINIKTDSSDNDDITHQLQQRLLTFMVNLPSANTTWSEWQNNVQNLHNSVQDNVENLVNVETAPEAYDSVEDCESSQDEDKECETSVRYLRSRSRRESVGHRRSTRNISNRTQIKESKESERKVKSCRKMVTNQPEELVREFLNDSSIIHKVLVKRSLSDEDIINMGALINKPKGSSTGELSLHDYLLNEIFVQGVMCKECNSLYSVEEYKTHITTEHNVTFAFPCDYCGEYIHEQEYAKHWSIHMMYFTCVKCEKKYPSKRKLQRHISQCGKEGKFPCEVCSKKFTSLQSVVQHKNFTHSTSSEEKDKYKKKCEICGKLTRNMYVHLKTHDTNTRPWVCDICGKSFKGKLLLHAHVKSHSTEPKIPTETFLCQICGRSFPRKISLKYHVQRHQGIRNYECNICTKKFMFPNQLSIHMLKHSDQYNFTCEVCGKAFKTMSNHKQHLDVVHIQSEAYKCPTCSREIFSRGNFRKHLRVHVNRGEYVPPDSPTEFKIRKDQPSINII